MTMPDQKPTLGYATPKQRTPLWIRVTSIFVGVLVGLTITLGAPLVYSLRHPASAWLYGPPRGFLLFFVVQTLSSIMMMIVMMFLLERRERRKRNRFLRQAADV